MDQIRVIGHRFHKQVRIVIFRGVFPKGASRVVDASTLPHRPVTYPVIAHFPFLDMADNPDKSADTFGLELGGEAALPGPGMLLDVLVDT